MSKAIPQAQYTPVGMRGWSLTKKQAEAVSRQVLHSHTFRAVHSRLSGSNVDPQDLLLGIGVVLAGFLVIDPFGVNKPGLRLVLWIAPGFVTSKCLYDSYRIARETEKRMLPSTLEDMRTVKWVDYWITSTGLSCIGLILRYLDSASDDSLLDILTRNSTAMLLFQSGILLWWIIGNQVSTTNQDGSEVVTREPSGMTGRTKLTDDPVFVDGVSRAVTISSKKGVKDSESPLPGTTSTSAVATRLRSVLTDTTLGEPVALGRKVTADQREKGDEAHTHTLESQLVNPYTKPKQRGVVSISSEETLSDDESVYSQPSGYETDMSKSLANTSVHTTSRAWPTNSSPRSELSIDLVKKPPGQSISMSKIGVPLRSRSPSTSASTSSRSASSSEEADEPDAPDIRSSKQKPSDSVTKGSTLPSPDNALNQVIPRPRPIVSLEPKKQDATPPPRTSRILAQLDNILLAELEEMGRSPAGITVDPSSLGRESPISPVLLQLHASGQTEQTIRQENTAVKGLHQRRSEQDVKQGNASLKVTDISLVSSPPQVNDKGGLDLQLDALLDTRMSDLFSVSVVSAEERKAKAKPLADHPK